MNGDKQMKRVKSEWTEVVLVCRKCSKKLDGGFGKKGEQSLAKGLRKALGLKGKGRKAAGAVIEVDCLDVCPKGAVVAVRAGRPGEWVVVAERADVGEVAERLGVKGVSPEKPSVPCHK